ncbi:mannosyltransferase family protein [Streptomyces sp. NPDC086787]|uniref:mannosyltransferase family protein n=1 Tax=Streptomyces sp. NPDC086787 TaxID=3365759 RepID=UPI0037F12F64
MTTTEHAPARSPSSSRSPSSVRIPGSLRIPGALRIPAPVRNRLTPTDLGALRLYLFTRLGLWLVAYCTAWLLPPGSDTKHPASWLSRWEQWDWTHYRHIAEYGYFGPFPGVAPASDNRVAFFPGFPLLLRAVHTLTGEWVVAGLLISLVSGAVAVVALARIAGLDRPDSALAGRRATAFLLLSPAAVFLAAGYTESLFLAFALPAWLAAKNRRWAVAGVLTALATATRISGLFLAAAIALECVLAARGGHRGRGLWRSLPWCALPAVPAAAYTLYLYANTGDWMAWKHAEERGWYRDFHTPAEAFRNTWNSAFHHLQTTGYAWEFQLELVAMTVGVLLLGSLLLRRRWPEAVYIALNLWALGTSYWYQSIPRATLLWWPLWTGLAHWSLRRPWVKEAYVAVVAPLMVILAVTFTSGRWTG